MKSKKQNTEVVKAYYSKLAKIYDEATGRKETQWKAPEKSNELILPHARVGDAVLDIGIGTGQSAKALFEKGCEITGIDIADGMLEETAKMFPEWELIDADISNGLPEEVMVMKFDIVISVGTLEFITDLLPLFTDVHTVTKDHGYFLFTYENLKEDGRIQNKRTAETGEINQGAKASRPRSFFHYRRTPDEVEEMLSDNGFIILEHEEFLAYKKTKKEVPVYNYAVLARKK